MMSDFGFSTKKLEKDQQTRLLKARQKREQEIKKEQLYNKMQLDLAERAELKKKLDLEAEEKRIVAEEMEMILTSGVRFIHSLIPYTIEGEDDKVILPERCLTELNEQNAFNFGVMLFRIREQDNNHYTHCGVREFSAPDGCIGLTKKVMTSISDAQRLMKNIEIKYVRLPKCTFVKLQPVHNHFFDVMPVKMVLEENLKNHVALTIGDKISVWYRGDEHQLYVTEIKPENHGTLIDTDVEVELELSQEYINHQKDQLNVSKHNNTSNYSIGSSSFSTNNLQNLDAVGYDEELLPESVDGDNSILIKIKLPTGLSLTRKFTHNSRIMQLFMFCKNNSNLLAEKIQFSTRPPQSKTISFANALDGKLFSDVGLISSNEMLFVTPQS
eukprot:gene16087-21854_t